MEGPSSPGDILKNWNRYPKEKPRRNNTARAAGNGRTSTFHSAAAEDFTLAAESMAGCAVYFSYNIYNKSEEICHRLTFQLCISFWCFIREPSHVSFRPPETPATPVSVCSKGPSDS